MNMARSTFYKRPHAGHRAAREKADTDLRVRIEDILAEFPAYGYRRVTHELRRRGLVINHKRVARVMREHALTPHRVTGPQPTVLVQRPPEAWGEGR